MFTAYVMVAIVASLLLAAVSGVGKLRRDPYIVKSVHKVVGVPFGWFPILAVVEFATAIGLIAGIPWALFGKAAATGMVVYFIGAIVAHLRVGDVRGAWPAVQMLFLALTALITRILSA